MTKTMSIENKEIVEALRAIVFCEESGEDTRDNLDKAVRLAKAVLGRKCKRCGYQPCLS